MHELSVMQNILDIVVEHAEKYNAASVTKINLEIGDLAGVIPEWMQMYFDFVSKGTIAEKAELCINNVPAVIKCRSCDNEFRLAKDNWQFFCPACDSTDVEILSGREYFIKSIEVS